MQDKSPTLTIPIEQAGTIEQRKKEIGIKWKKGEKSDLKTTILSFCGINRKGSYKSSLNLEKLFCLNIGKHSLKHKQIRKYY